MLNGALTASTLDPGRCASQRIIMHGSAHHATPQLSGCCAVAVAHRLPTSAAKRPCHTARSLPLQAHLKTHSPPAPLHRARTTTIHNTLRLDALAHSRLNRLTTCALPEPFPCRYSRVPISPSDASVRSGAVLPQASSRL